MPISSPFEAVHLQLGARFAEYDQWKLPCDYNDPVGEKAALQNGCAAFDLSSFGRINVKGPGADDALNQVCGGLPDKGSWKQIGSVRILHTGKGYTVLTLPKARHRTLQQIRDSAGETAGVVDVTEKTAMLGVYGPNAFTAIKNVIPFDLSQLEPGKVQSVSVFMINIIVVRGSWLTTDGMELICPLMAANLAAGAVAKYHKRENITPAGMECLYSELNRMDDKPQDG